MPSAIRAETPNQLHSAINDAPYWLVWIACFSCLAFSLIGLTVLRDRGELKPALLVIPIQAAAFLGIALWLRSRRVRVYATPEGLLVGVKGRLVPWSGLNAVRNLSDWGGLLLPLYRLTFDEGKTQLLFYACADIEHEISHYWPISPASSARY